jgi:hypothetical protein
MLSLSPACPAAAVTPPAGASPELSPEFGSPATTLDYHPSPKKPSRAASRVEEQEREGQRGAQ